MVIQRFRPYFSGQGVQVEQLCQELARRGRRSTVLTAIRGQPTAVENCDGYDVVRLRADLLPGSARRGFLWMLTFAARVFLELRRRRAEIDVVHVHALTDALYAAWLACRLSGLPIVFEMTLLGDDDPVTVRAQHLWLRRLRYRIYRSCDAYVAMSGAFLPSCREAGLDLARVEVIPQGVDVSRFLPLPEPERARVRAELHLPADCPLVVFVGSLIERKGIDLLLAAWESVGSRHPMAHLLLAGRDDFAPGSPEDALLATGLESLPEPARARVHRLGLRDDPERLLGAADVFAFPSRREGFGSVIIEAMACGAPAVVAELPGITDLIFAHPASASDPGSDPDGLVVPQEDAAALACALDRLLGDAALARRIGERGRERAHAAFRFDKVAARYEELYGRLRPDRGPA